MRNGSSGYGHASVAEHAVLHVAFENVSRLAIECLESNRLASYTEKSTRYQKWESDDFHSPAELRDHALLDEFTRVCRLLFRTSATPSIRCGTWSCERTTRRENESAEALDRRVRSQYVDVCRFLLPAAALANVGMTANARVLENALRKLLSHELQEVQRNRRAAQGGRAGGNPNPGEVRRGGAVSGGNRPAACARK